MKKAKSSVRNAGRVLDMPMKLVDKVAKLIPMDGDLREIIEQSLELSSLYQTDNNVKQIYKPTARKILEMMLQMEDKSNLFLTNVAIEYIFVNRLIIQLTDRNANRSFTSKINSVGMFNIYCRYTIQPVSINKMKVPNAMFE